MSSQTERALLIFTVARLLDGVRHVAVGASSPIPAAGAMLRRAMDERDGRPEVRLSILGSTRHNFFTNGSGELFDCAAQGRIDALFLGGGQIDGQGNINLVGTGHYPQCDVRWPGSFGSSYLYFVVPRVILFREEHSRRVLVDKVDFISAPGVSAPGTFRTGGPYALLTGMALFGFDRQSARFVLESVHPGHNEAEVARDTGFAFARSSDIGVTPLPDSASLSLLNGRVLEELDESYPDFAARIRLDRASGAGRDCPVAAANWTRE
jgi:glutaconate CoA-transferase, subunit B